MILFKKKNRASLVGIGINAGFLVGTNSFVAKRILCMALFLMFTCLTYGMSNTKNVIHIYIY